VNLFARLRARVAKWFAPKPCERCGAPGCCVYLRAAVRVVEGPGGVSIGVRVSAKTPPAQWLCKPCAAIAMDSGRRQ
jgi:hypothetical protein